MTLIMVCLHTLTLTNTHRIGWTLRKQLPASFLCFMLTPSPPISRVFLLSAHHVAFIYSHILHGFMGRSEPVPAHLTIVLLAVLSQATPL